jgi:hypothetical protein
MLLLLPPEDSWALGPFSFVYQYSGHAAFVNKLVIFNRKHLLIRNEVFCLLRFFCFSFFLSRFYLGKFDFHGGPPGLEAREKGHILAA